MEPASVHCDVFHANVEFSDGIAVFVEPGTVTDECTMHAPMTVSIGLRVLIILIEIVLYCTFVQYFQKYEPGT
jgi:hypothetical protein